MTDAVAIALLHEEKRVHEVSFSVDSRCATTADEMHSALAPRVEGLIGEGEALSEPRFGERSLKGRAVIAARGGVRHGRFAGGGVDGGRVRPRSSAQAFA